MSVDPSIEVLDEGPDDVETVLISWLGPLLPLGQIANGRLPDDPLPFVVVNHLPVDNAEDLEMSWVDELVSVHCLYRKGIGNENLVLASKFADAVHRRMLLLGRYLEPVMVNGHAVDIDFVDVTMRPSWKPYQDETILRKMSRYRIGQGYAKLH